MKTSAVIFVIGALLVACSGSKVLIPVQADADRAAKTNSTITLEALNQGKTIFEQNCNRCHGYKNPTSRSAEKWQKIIPRMVAKVNKKMKKEQIDAKGQELILNYVVTMSEVKASN